MESTDTYARALRTRQRAAMHAFEEHGGPPTKRCTAEAGIACADLPRETRRRGTWGHVTIYQRTDSGRGPARTYVYAASEETGGDRQHPKRCGYNNDTRTICGSGSKSSRPPLTISHQLRNPPPNPKKKKKADKRISVKKKKITEKTTRIRRTVLEADRALNERLRHYGAPFLPADAPPRPSVCSQGM